MKKRLCQVHGTEELLRIQKALDGARIAYETRPEASSMLKSLYYFIFYRVLSPGIDRGKDPIGIYVGENDLERAKKLI